MRPDLKAASDAAQIRREQMISLHESGMDYREIAERFGITPTRVRQLIRNGLDYRDRNEAKDGE